jgi:CheY-like chemotaxis protein
MLSNPKILVVDDEPDIRHLIEVVLQASQRWNVLSADCGDQAIEIAARERPSLILLDRRMPNGDGLTTLLRLREDPRTRDTPVILMTANVQGVPPGFAGVITKPFDPFTLLTRVATIFDASREADR